MVSDFGTRLRTSRKKKLDFSHLSPKTLILDQKSKQTTCCDGGTKVTTFVDHLSNLF